MSFLNDLLGVVCRMLELGILCTVFTRIGEKK